MRSQRKVHIPTVKFTQYKRLHILIIGFMINLPRSFYVKLFMIISLPTIKVEKMQLRKKNLNVVIFCDRGIRVLCTGRNVASPLKTEPTKT